MENVVDAGIWGISIRRLTVQDTYDFFATAASKDKQMKIYGGLFHEIFNEYCRDEVISDAISWLQNRC